MVSDTGMIVVSLISLAGMVLLYTLNTSTWFKKENFKIQKKAVMDENRIKIKKVERELGITGATKPYRETQTPLQAGGNLLDILKNLEGDQVKMLADKFLKPADDIDDYDAPPRSTIDSLLDFAANNPEIAKGILDGVSGGQQGKQDEEKVYN